MLPVPAALAVGPKMQGGACSALRPYGREVWRDGVVRNRRVIGLGLGPCVWVRVGLNCVQEHTLAGQMKPVRGYRDFNVYVVYFCDTTFELVSRQLAGPGEVAVEQARAGGPFCP